MLIHYTHSHTHSNSTQTHINILITKKHIKNNQQSIYCSLHDGVVSVALHRAKSWECARGKRPLAQKPRALSGEAPKALFCVG